jgi:hypothetical protein
VAVTVGDSLDTSASNHRINVTCCNIHTGQRNQDDAINDHSEERKS